MNWLFHAGDLRRHGDPTIIEFAAAATGFLCFSAGGALTALGKHIFDQVEISERWASRPYFPLGESREPSLPAFLPISNDDFIPARLRNAANQVPARHAQGAGQAGAGNATI